MSCDVTQYLVLLLVILLGHCVDPSAGQCTWEYRNGSAVTCSVRRVEKQGLDLSGAEGTARLDIRCNEQFLFESQLPVRAFARLPLLNELTIESCKLLQLPAHAFAGMTNLKRLTVQTNNFAWAPGKTLDIRSDAFVDVKDLQHLDLNHNNLRHVSEGVLCHLNNLQHFNISHNRIRAAENLGFATVSQCTGGQDLHVLDGSYNELQTIPEGWGVSRLRRLQQLHMQHNNITQMSSESLIGLSSLRVLNMSYNRLETLPEGLFAGSRELREIHLQKNELYSLPRGVFHRLEQLLVLDVSSNSLTSHHITDGTFSGLIRLIILNLAHNAITRIDSRTFKELYFLQILNLRNNSIGHIEENAFLPLYNLHTLILAENRLHTIDDKLLNGLYVLSKLTLNNNLITSIDPNAFRNCSDLKELDLSTNQLVEVPEAIQNLSMLRTLDLGENQISAFGNGSFLGLVQLTGLRMIDNFVGNITRGMFWDLPRLNVLNLARNRVQFVERGAFETNTEIEAIRLDKNFISDINGVFATLTSLLWLNLSENHLVWFDYAFIPKNLRWLDIHNNFIEALRNYYKLQEEISVETMDASHNRLIEVNAMSVPNSVQLFFINNNLIHTIHPNTFVDKVNLTRVDLYANVLTNLQMHNIRVAPVPEDRKLPEFYLGGNPLECDCTMDWLSRINNLTTRQHPKIMDLSNIACVMPHARRSPVLRPASALSPSDFLCRYDTHCFALCHCCDFDACDCEMTCPDNCTCYHDTTWNANIVDCGGGRRRHGGRELLKKVPMDASELYLDGIEIEELQNHAFLGRKNLKVLYLNNTKLTLMHNRTFAGLNALTVLNLADNHLRLLEGDEFENLVNLRELYLQNNRLRSVTNATLEPLHSLQILRIDGNQLIQFPLWQLQVPPFDQLHSLTLGRNSWSCRCRDLQELTSFVADNAVIIQDSQDIYCIDPAGVKRELDLNASSICSDFYAIGSMMGESIFNDYIPIMIGCAILAIVILLIVLIYIFREPVRVWFFTQYGVRVTGAKCDKSEKLYDALVLHSTKDSEWITRELAPELERGRPGLRLCLQHRDLVQDASYVQLLEAAQASKRVVIVLSPNFLQTEWSRVDVRHALHEGVKGRPNKLVIVEESDVFLDATADCELLPYLKSTAVRRVKRLEQQFTEKLRYALPAESVIQRRGNNYTLDHHHERIKQPASPGVVFRPAPPPAYCPDGDDPNYSSATTATPSPRPMRKNLIHHPHHLPNGVLHPVHHTIVSDGASQRPPSEHIYSSIDSDYSTLDRENMVVDVHRLTWRSSSNHSHRPARDHRVQAYLV
ncbi:TOLL [Sergentomyia squamirostris]